MKCFHWFGVELNLLFISFMIILSHIVSLFVLMFLSVNFTDIPLLMYLTVLYAVNLILLLIVHIVKG